MANWVKKRRLACEPRIAVKHPLIKITKDMFCWGSSIHGELGLGGIEDENILIPREVDFKKATDVQHIACGENYTIVITHDGQIYSCGNNDYGQLGHAKGRKRLQLVPDLDAFVFKKAACGAYHTLAVNEWGQLFSWGSNGEGQLGLNNKNIIEYVPRMVKTLGTSVIVQIACGMKHTLALTNDGKLYSWGSNSAGQLGLGSDTENEIKPTLVNSLVAVPVAFIACGGFHSIAISKSGAIFGWGKNTFGQLGLNDTQNRNTPCQLQTLQNAKVCYAACGEEFSVFLTLDGGVFTCGAGMYGQLGHGNNSNEILPRQVMELMGSTVTQISCGKRHTLALVPSRGKVYAWGLGGAGQLGNQVTCSVATPQVVRGPWVAPNGTSMMDLDKEFDPSRTDYIVRHIFTGGDHCFATVVPRKDNIEPDDCRILESVYQILEINEEQLMACQRVPQSSPIDHDLMTYLQTVFESEACINGSFLLNNDNHYGCSSKQHGLDLERASRSFGIIRELDNNTIQELIFTCISESLIPSFVSSLVNTTPRIHCLESLRIYLILPLYHGFANPLNCNLLHNPFCKAVLLLQPDDLEIVSKWWIEAPSHYFERLVRIHKSVVLHYVKQAKPNKGVSWDMTLQRVLHQLRLLNILNNQGNKRNIVPYATFHLPELIEFIDIREDYIKWISEKESSYQNVFCHYPFLLDAQAKTILLETDQAIQMQSAMNEAATRAVTHQMFFDPFSVNAHHNIQFLLLNVSRENIVADTLLELSRYSSTDLKKPLRVKFHGEEAEDAGGVKKEFFMLLLKEILDPKYGMFKQYEETRIIWFSEDSLEDENMYFLIGILCGLVIYNFIIIDLPFPLALYKKLLHEPVGLIDIKEMSPVLAKSMQSILDYDEPDFEEVFCLNFEVAREAFGEKRIYELLPGGSKVPVTLKNKKQFVDLYVDYILNKSVERHFQEFHKGFHRVCGGRVLELFHSHELMAVVVGNEDYDWEELEKNAMYKEGYSKNDPTIILFWQVFRELPLEEKKKFLLFLTGSDRIPIQGMKAIKITIQPTNDERMLPVAHTCFNLLDLPRYQTRERLRYKLQQAIQQTHGFSLV
ncbi:probable E3 ubiquitin-protein ligase HERC4 isoform X1 [Hylaeus volcanicus]|uniref:probable E3 ubiquitin-protein ligase HERC4 isoform X1 n=2 Tax=Hylaeus volcanicus TaxID=313075 RepID=UPI0023B82B48|nr:probable E3 ubiquitin-protein ligase HERC4 isoform X1 [Hylaeus volcanicus]XP_053977185.1 probable E3 ubiquitin-protein ligase HERC4 isoform X1 [Hylaeus volcanicus]